LGFCDADEPEESWLTAGMAAIASAPSKSEKVSKNAQNCALREEFRMQVIENIGIGAATPMLV
jgi:hypothetical protein